MAGRKQAPAKKSTKKSVSKTVEQALKGSRTVAARKPKKITPAQELRSIERLLGDEFDSLPEARRALREQSKPITERAVKAFRKRQEAERVSFDVPQIERGRKGAPKRKPGPSKPAPPPAPPPELPAPPAIEPGTRLADLPGLEGKSMLAALREIERNPEKYDRLLAPNQQIGVKIWGNSTRKEFPSFRSMVQKLKEYPRKNMTRDQLQKMWQGITITAVGPGGVHPVVYRAKALEEKKTIAAARAKQAELDKAKRAEEKRELREAKKRAQQKEREAKRATKALAKAEQREKKLQAELEAKKRKRRKK